MLPVALAAPLFAASLQDRSAPPEPPAAVAGREATAALRLRSAPAVAGAPLEYRLVGASPAAPSALLLDLRRLPAPRPLGLLGELHLAGTPLFTLLPGDGSLAWSVPLPDDPRLVGRTVHAQALATPAVGGSARLTPPDSRRISATTGPARFLFVPEVGEDQLSLFAIDDASGRLLHRGWLATEPAPVAAAASPDGAHLYLAESGVDQVAVYLLDAALGVPERASTSPAGAAPAAIAVAPDGSAVYVGNAASGDVSQFARDPGTGALTPLDPPTVPGAQRPTALAVSADGTRLFQTGGVGQSVALFDVDPGTGALTPAGTAAAPGLPNDVDLSADGSVLYVTDGQGAGVRAFDLAVDPPALLGAADAGALPGAFAVSPAGDFAFATDLATGTLRGFAVDPSDGTLTPLAQPPVPCGSGPVEVVVEPGGRRVLVAAAGDSELRAFAIEAGTGALSEVGRWRTRATPLDLALVCGEAPLAPRDAALFVPFEDEAILRGYAVDEGSGALSALPGPPLATGAEPVVAGVSPLGTLALVPSSTANDCAAALVDAAGAPTPLGGPLAVGGPGTGVAFEPSSRFAYVAVAALDALRRVAIDEAPPAVALGPLLSLGGGGFVRGIAVDPTGRFVAAARGLVRNVAVRRIVGLDGSLDVVGDVEVNGEPLTVAWHPSGRFAYVTTLSPTTLAAYRVDPWTGVWTAAGPPESVAGTPRSLSISADGRFLYTADGAFGTVSAFALDLETGQPSMLFGAGAPVPDARAVRASVRGDRVWVAGGSGALHAFAVDPQTGALSPVATLSTGGSGPSDLAPLVTLE